LLQSNSRAPTSQIYYFSSKSQNLRRYQVESWTHPATIIIAVLQSVFAWFFFAIIQKDRACALDPLSGLDKCDGFCQILTKTRQKLIKKHVPKSSNFSSNISWQKKLKMR
jgi:hypothetical protein